MPFSRTHLCLTAGLIAAIACGDDPTGPTESPNGRMEAGQTVLVRFDTVPGPQDLYFDAEPGTGYTLEVSHANLGVTLSVRDSATSAGLLAHDLTVIEATPAVRRTSPVFSVHEASTVRLTIYRWDYPEPAGELHLTLRTVSLAPEHIAAGIALGSDITGESLEGATDIDEFTFIGTAGQILHPSLDLPGTPDLTRLACLDLYTPGGTHLKEIAMSPGDTFPPVGWPGSRVTLPADGEYRVRIGDGWNGCRSTQPLSYTGPYGFRLEPIDPGPEVASATVALGDTVLGESIGETGDLDRFTIQGAAGSLVEVLVRRAVGTTGLQIAVGAAAARALGPGDTLYGTRPLGRFTLADSGKLSVVVSGLTDGPRGDTGGYTFIAFPIDTAPETHAATFALGDSITDEVIDPESDIDRFTFTGTAGQFAWFEFRSDLGAFGEPIRAEILQPDGQLLASMGHPNSYDTTTVRSGRLDLALSGTYVARVSGIYTGQGPKHRGFRLRSGKIDPAPETHGDTFAFGDTLTGESLDGKGDVDRFYVHVTEPGLAAYISLRVDSSAVGAAAVRADLRDSATGEVVVSALASKGETSTSGMTGLGTKTYYVEVRDQGAWESSITGGYEVRTFAFSTGPEIAGDTVMLGDTVTTETLSSAVDIDRFRFAGTRRQSVLLSFAGTGVPGDSLTLFFGPLNQIPALGLYAASGGGALGSVTSMRLDLEETGQYEFDIRGAKAGPYAFSIVDFPTVPEVAAGTLASGDSVVTEAIGTPGDLDRFTVTGTPGHVVVVQLSSAAGPGNIGLRVHDPATGEGLAGFDGVGGSSFTSGLITIPAGGEIEVRVAEFPPNYTRGCHNANCHDVYQYTGAYTITTTDVDPSPEVAPTAMTVGDTVLGESIGSTRDIDEFTITGTAGVGYWIVLHADAAISGTSGLMAQVIDPVNGAVIYQVETGFESTLTSTSLTFPHSGQYKVRVFGQNGMTDTGPYWLLIRTP